MPIGRISGQLLKDNLLRDGVNLKFENDLLYLLVSDSDSDNHRIGIKNSNPAYTLDVTGVTRSTDILTGKAEIDDVEINDNVIRSTVGPLNIRAATPVDNIVVDNDVLINGNLHATGSITADGSLTFGDQDTDNIVFNADVNSHILPDIDDTFDLGSLTKSWRQIYVDDMRLGGPEVGDAYNFAQTSIPGSGTLPAKTFTGIDNPQNYTKISNTFSQGHLTLTSNGNGLIELINDTRIHNDLNVLGDVATDNANYILLGDPEYGILDGAVEMTPQTSLTDGVAQLNLTLTLLVPSAPPSFPNGVNLLINNLTQRIINEESASQPLNGNTLIAPARGTIVYVARVNSFSTTTIAGTGPGNRGSITVRRNTVNTVNKLLTFGNRTQIITTTFIGTTSGSQEVKYIQPSAGVLVPGYLIRIANSGSIFGGLVLNATYIITSISSKVLKMSEYNTVTGVIGSPFVATSTATGSLSFSTINDENTFSANNTNLILTNNLAYPEDTPGFHETIDFQISGTNVPPGWNTVEILHSDAGTTTIGSNITNIGLWYYDNSGTIAPVFSNQTFSLNTQSLTYSSSIPHYNNSTVYDIGFDVTWNGGKTSHPDTNSNILTTNAVGPWTNAGNKNYTSFGYISLPSSSNVSAGLGPNSQIFRVNVINGFGSWNTVGTVPVYTADNSYTTSQSALPPLNSIILYKTGTTSSTTFLDETNIFFAAAVGGSTTGATRCQNPDNGIASQDTPVFTSGSPLFNSQISALLSTDATVVGTDTGVNSLKHDITNYSSGYLPVGPNLSTRTASVPQYFTFRFVRSGVSKFRIRWATPTGIAGIWAAMPGANGTSLKSGHVNSWLNTAVDNSLAGGCALGGNLPTGSGTRQVNVSFGTLSSTNSTNNEIWVRIRLNQGQSMTSLYLDVSDQ